MAHVVFWEKPGCAGHGRQKALLLAAGHVLEVRDLLGHPWTAAELRPFLAGLPVADWFDRAAPRLKAREVVPEALGEAEALALLLEDHRLIRRPLLQVGGRREAGFLAAVVQDWIGLEPATAPAGGLDGCAGGACGPRAAAPVVLGRPRASAG